MESLDNSIASFKEILVSLRKAKAKTTVNRHLLRSNQKLRKNIYETYGLAGATYAVADNQSRQLVLIQDGVEEAIDYPKLDVPIIEKPAKKYGTRLSVLAYNDFAHHLFQRHRDNQGFGRYAGAMSFTQIPEMFAGLEPRNPGASDYVYRTNEELDELICCWRALWVGIERFGKDEKLSKLQDHITSGDSEKPILKRGTRRFSSEYFVQLSIADPIVETWIGDLDNKASWEKAENKAAERAAWTKLRKTLDTVNYSDEFVVATGVADLPTKFQGSDIDRIRYALESFESRTQDPTLEEAVKELHGKHNLPVPAYFYYQIMDGSPKEHLVAPILRSKASPVYYFAGDGSGIKEHTVVFAVLVALNSKHCERKSTEIVELVTILREMAEELVDSIFIGGLQRLNEPIAKRRRETNLKSTQTRDISGNATPPRTFVVGTFDSRVSLVSQQIRALTLVDSLFRSGILEEDSEVGVIGGGVAGVTVACACLLNNAKVTLFEKSSALMTLQENAEHRYLHPNILDWPLAGSGDTTAHLPILAWPAGNADKVVEYLRKEFTHYQNRFGRKLKQSLGTEVTDVKATKTNKTRVEYRKPNGKSGHQHFQVTILCIGFGNEIAAADTPSYWDGTTDELEQSCVDGVTRSIFISGNGDGGLIDLARAMLKNPNDDNEPVHAAVIKFLVGNISFKELSKKMENIDSKARAALLTGGKVLNLREEYKTLQVLPNLENDFRRFIRTDTEVVFTYRGNSPYRTNTALINRAIVFLIDNAKTVQMIECHDPKFEKDNRSQVWIRGRGWNHFDKVILRYGPPEPRNRLDFATLKKNEVWRSLDSTHAFDLIDHLEPDQFAHYRNRAEELL